RDAGRVRELLDLSVVVRQELVQGRGDETDRYWQPVHRAEDAGKVLALHRQDLRERLPPPITGFREKHLAHGMDALAVEEHVLRAAQADALRPELAGLLRVLWRIGVRADGESPERIGPLHQPVEVLV